MPESGPTNPRGPFRENLHANGAAAAPTSATSDSVDVVADKSHRTRLLRVWILLFDLLHVKFPRLRLNLSSKSRCQPHAELIVAQGGHGMTITRAATVTNTQSAGQFAWPARRLLPRALPRAQSNWTIQFDGGRLMIGPHKSVQLGQSESRRLSAIKLSVHCCLHFALKWTLQGEPES